MKKSIVLLACIMGYVIVTRAQPGNNDRPVKKNCSCSFSALLQGGSLEGESSSYLQLQTIFGMRYKTWFAGIGTGIDYYTYRGYPLFLDVRKSFSRKATAPFLYADGGIHIPYRKNEKSDWAESNYKNGFYYDVGAGLKFSFSKLGGLFASAGYSYKQGEKRQKQQYCPFGCVENINTYTYNFNRLSLKLGWQF
jgi:hypothetical protein